ncbi:MAG: response regulator, partial [Desulfobulbaceae bacterium]
MSKKAIMFVDDEPNILSGIKRMLRSMRKEYSFYFAESGKEALGMMEDDPVDVVVSDMRMPGMDGAEFLTEVQSKFPLAIRIMLTGQADEESILRTVNVVHQFLAKPCEPDNLKDVLARAGVLHDIMANSDLKELVSSIGSLPSLPSVYSQLQEALKDPEVTADQVAEIIEKDIAMTAKLLQLVNSSFFGL